MAQHEYEEKYRNRWAGGRFSGLRCHPRASTVAFHRDIFKDLKDLEKGIDKNDPENSSLDLFSLEMFENIAYVMANARTHPSRIHLEDWLDSFNTFSTIRCCLRS